MTEQTTPPLAVTGATGFVGRRVLALANRPVRALTRRPQPPQPGVEWVLGDLGDTHALARLCEGAAAVLHIAGVVNAADEAGFTAGNVTGTANVLAAAAGVPRFVHVSSLAAREPRLSMYGASKAQGDALAMASDRDWVIVRPPGVYGPGDAEMRDLFRLARFGLGLAPGGPNARISLIHVDDLARALLALTHGGPSREILEIDDGSGGYAHADHAAAIGRALGKANVRMIPIGSRLISTAAAIATRLAGWKGELPKLSRDRARYLAHPDWVARGGNQRLAGLWQPQIGLDEGMADTVRDYRARGWL
ncbi:NAD-dependent epimerase/dehydratase family protein [Sandarakinorhabdus sp. AAP62]|uniref:NAD-dependent epimerase/dehydratase family protein n=1 Tax=Sandarakinorhabdus sp. AAP62 TaxID=1248916 RepID=UPI0002DD222F|nr:NAD-dependent epimerase/dehydratase family protein [Sandarakinorhabdus sp. AAP62]